MAFPHMHTLFLVAQHAHFVADFSLFPDTRYLVVRSGGFNQNNSGLGAGLQIGVLLSKQVCSEVPING